MRAAAAAGGVGHEHELRRAQADLAREALEDREAAEGIAALVLKALQEERAEAAAEAAVGEAASSRVGGEASAAPAKQQQHQQKRPVGTVPPTRQRRRAGSRAAQTPAAPRRRGRPPKEASAGAVGAACTAQAQPQLHGVAPAGRHHPHIVPSELEQAHWQDHMADLLAMRAIQEGFGTAAAQHAAEEADAGCPGHLDVPGWELGCCGDPVQRPDPAASKPAADEERLPPRGPFRSARGAGGRQRGR